MLPNFDEVLNNLKRISKESGKILLNYFNTDKLNIQTKSTIADILTQADLESDEHIRNELIKLYPNAGIITEENSNIEPKFEGENSYWFCADPLDGTTNFSCNMPHFSISIAMLDYLHQPLIGVVYDPNRDELFFAIKNKGSFLETSKGIIELHCRKNQTLINSLVVTGFHPSHIYSNDNNLTELSLILPKVRCIRRLGSACLDFCWIAACRFDAYWEKGPHIWDVAAGWLIAIESGALVTDFQGNQFNKETLALPMISVLVAIPDIHNELLNLIKEARKKFEQ